MHPSREQPNYQTSPFTRLQRTAGIVGGTGSRQPLDMAATPGTLRRARERIRLSEFHSEAAFPPARMSGAVPRRAFSAARATRNFTDPAISCSPPPAPPVPGDRATRNAPEIGNVPGRAR